MDPTEIFFFFFGILRDYFFGNGAFVVLESKKNE